MYVCIDLFLIVIYLSAYHIQDHMPQQQSVYFPCTQKGGEGLERHWRYIYFSSIQGAKPGGRVKRDKFDTSVHSTGLCTCL